MGPMPSGTVWSVNCLSKSVPFPIVTQILGHKSSDTTLNSYARIDLNNFGKVCSVGTEHTIR